MDCEICKEKRNVISQTPKAELMDTLQVINPRLYAGVIKKLKAEQKRGQHRFGVALFFILFPFQK